MANVNLPTNVYSLRQSEFGIIPSNPWVYWVSEDIRNLFQKFKAMEVVAKPRQGIATSDNFRFTRNWFEIGIKRINIHVQSHEEALNCNGKWFVYLKGAGQKKWLGGFDTIVNWQHDGKEIKSFDKSVIRNPDFFFKVGITWTLVGANGFSARINPGGAVFDVGGSCAFPIGHSLNLTLLGVLNSPLITYLLRLLNPTINTQVGDIARLPVPSSGNEIINYYVLKLIRYSLLLEMEQEEKINYNSPILQNNNPFRDYFILHRINSTQVDLQKEIFKFYGVSIQDQKRIDEELMENVVSETEDTIQIIDNDEIGEIEVNSIAQKISIKLISYSIGVVLQKFNPGSIGSIGSAIYRRSDFAIGSLPEPSEGEFNELVGEPSQFAYIDEQGGRHVFSRQVEQALQKLALPDGIAVFDPSHPRDLPTLVSKALELMLGQAQAQEVIQQAAGGDLRKFLEKDFFTQHHIKQYRKRPVYWPIQSSKRSYGFVLFHEKIDRNTFYALQQEPYLPTKRRAVQLRLEELGKKVLTAQGAARKPIEKEMDELRQLAEELAQFAKDLDAITRGGYEPEADWIDDGVILRMAPLWSVIPLWKSEPKKYWEELAAGKYDWSRIAMKYWPERVKQACKKNKSYAIAHGHEEWYVGN